MKITTASVGVLLAISIVTATDNVGLATSTTTSTPNMSVPTRQITDSDRNQQLIARMKADYYIANDCEILPQEIGDSTIGPGRFVAINDITIRKYRTLTITPGTTIFFEPQRRLIVEGTLLAASTSNGKIVLTHTPIDMRYIKIAIADSLWNGISLEPGSSLLLNHIYLNNAVTGVTTSSEVKQVDIACVDMSRNVQTPLFSNGKQIFVKNIRCISTADLLRPLDQTPRTITVCSDTISGIRTIPVAPPFPIPGKTLFNIGSGIVAASGISAATYGFWRYRKYALRYEESTDRAIYSPRQIDRYKDKAESGGLIGILGSITGIVGAAGLVTLHFVF